MLFIWISMQRKSANTYNWILLFLSASNVKGMTYNRCMLYQNGNCDVYFRLFFGHLFHIAGFWKCRKIEFFPWVLSYFLELWGFFLEFWVFSSSLGFCFSVFVATVARLEGYLDYLSMQICVMDINTKPGHNKRLRWIKHVFRESNFFRKMPKIWVLSLSFSFFLEFWGFFALSFFSIGQKKSLG